MKNLLKSMKRPKKIEFQHDELIDNYGRFVAQPFERGFGTTLGNALRRVLMSSIEGAAITALRIEGVNHEFSYIDGVEEDVTMIILNLKQIHLKYDQTDKDEPKLIKIQKSGVGELVAGDFAIDSSIEILNPNLHIARMSEDADMDVEIQIEKGRGFIPAEILKKNIEEIGTIAIDALFSPILAVNFHVEDTRVGQRGDYEKLIIEVTTNGSIAPDDALAYAAKILKNHLTVFVNFEEEPDDEEQVNEADEKLRALLAKNVEELEMSVRSLNVLKSLEIEYMAELVRKTPEELKKSKHFSELCLNEIRGKVEGLGLSFGMRDI
jgi:DNA-directed RNA polymerase subunit alpha